MGRGLLYSQHPPSAGAGVPPRALGCPHGVAGALWGLTMATLCFGCSSTIRTALTSSPAVQPGRALRPPRCWAGSLPRPFLGPALCPPMAVSQEQTGGISSRTWACFPYPERKPAAQTLLAPGSSTACGSPVTTGTWRRGSSQRLWPPSHPLHRRVPCPPDRHQPSSPPCPHSHVPHGSDSPSSLASCPRAAYPPDPTCPGCSVPGPRSPCGCTASDLMLRPFADAALKRLASLLASYGLGLPELSPQQLSSLSALLQLLQSSGERGAGTGQAGTGSSGCQHAMFRDGGVASWGGCRRISVSLLLRCCWP